MRWSFLCGGAALLVAAGLLSACASGGSNAVENKARMAPISFNEIPGWNDDRQGEALAALQHVVAAIYRHEASEGRRLVVDCMGYRKGKDDELKQMALFLGGKAKDTGLAQEIGPLNPYERRIVHLAVAELETVTSESIGDAFEKTVIISVK